MRMHTVCGVCIHVIYLQFFLMCRFSLVCNLDLEGLKFTAEECTADQFSWEQLACVSLVLHAKRMTCICSRSREAALLHMLLLAHASTRVVPWTPKLCVSMYRARACEHMAHHARMWVTPLAL
jgi:hypothetical protein